MEILKSKDPKIKINFKDEISNRKYVVCIFNTPNGYVWCRKKDSDSWELPGGKIENGETIYEAAIRELKEETGAIFIPGFYSMIKICDYEILINNYLLGGGTLFYVYCDNFGNLDSKFEMEEIIFSNTIPEKLSYPIPHKLHFYKVLESLNNNKLWLHNGVYKSLVNDYGWSYNDAVKLFDDSKLIDSMYEDPELIFHHNTSYWAKHIMKIYDYDEIEKDYKL